MKQDVGQRANGTAQPYPRGGDILGVPGSRWDEEAKREVLRRSELDPFVEVTNTLSGPEKLERNTG